MRKIAEDGIFRRSLNKLKSAYGSARDWANGVLDQYDDDALANAGRTFARGSLSAGLGTLRNLSNVAAKGWKAVGFPRMAEGNRQFSQMMDEWNRAQKDYYKDSNNNYRGSVSANLVGGGSYLLGKVPEVMGVKTLYRVGPWSAPINATTNFISRYAPKAMSIAGASHISKDSTPQEAEIAGIARELPGEYTKAINPAIAGWNLLRGQKWMQSASAENGVNTAMDIAGVIQPRGGWQPLLWEHTQRAAGATRDWAKNNPGKALASVQATASATPMAYYHKQLHGGSMMDSVRHVYNDMVYPKKLADNVRMGNHSWLLSAVGIQGTPASYQPNDTTSAVKTLWKNRNEAADLMLNQPYRRYVDSILKTLPKTSEYNSGALENYTGYKLARRALRAADKKLLK